jgi:hypothetical protein
MRSWRILGKQVSPLLPGYRDMEAGGMLDTWLKWFEANPNLSGWAQTIGALLALVVAIITPALQHHLTERRRALDEQSLDLYLCMATRMVLHDILCFGRRVIELIDLPREEIRDELMVSELLERLRNLEIRDKDLARQASQYAGRWAVLSLAQFLNGTHAQVEELTPQLTKIFKDNLSHIEAEMKKVGYLIDHSIYRLTLLQCSAWRRPLIWVYFKTKRGRAALTKMAEKQLVEQQSKIARGY